LLHISSSLHPSNFLFFFFLLLLLLGGWGEAAHLAHWQLFGLLYQPWMIEEEEEEEEEDNDCGAISGMRIGKSHMT
jgi:hypothetical protein